MLNSIAIIGKGKVGKSLAAAIRANTNYELQTHTAARATKFPVSQAEVLIIASKDDTIIEVANRALRTMRPRLVIHLAGSQPSWILPEIKGVARLTLHPIQAFAKASNGLFRGIYFMASSGDPVAITWAKGFAKRIGAKGILEVSGEDLALYHSLMVFASNFTVLLGGAVEQLSESIGQDPRKIKGALRPLMEQVLTNVLTRESHQVLTGPISRKDVGTIRKHQKALRTFDPKLRKLYDAFLEYANSHGY